MEKRKIKPCEQCGTNRWKTIKKGTTWRCHACDLIRENEEEHD